MIEFRQGKTQNIYYLFQDGKSLEGIIIEKKHSIYYGRTSLVNVITALSRKAGEELLTLIDKDHNFPEYERLEIRYWKFTDDIKFIRLEELSTRNYFTFEVLVKDLDNQDSEVEFLGFFIGLKGKDFDVHSTPYFDSSDHTSYRIDINKRDLSLLECALESEKKIKEFYDTAVNKFFNEIELSIFTIFNFHENLKSSCEQYLLYFAQFLQDIGINATSNLKEEAGKVLFSVTPIDDKVALEKIREALAVYLNLPASPIVYDDSFAAMRLQQQVENLQHSQRMAVRELQFNEKLLIAQSDTIHGKNITISQQQSVIEQQQKIIEKISSKSIMMDSVENKEELEKIYDGLEVSYSKWLFELTGIKANFVKLISSAVKNTLGKDEKKSELGLDEEKDI